MEPASKTSSVLKKAGFLIYIKEEYYNVVRATNLCEFMVKSKKNLKKIKIIGVFVK